MVDAIAVSVALDPIDRPRQTLVERDRGLPAHELLRERRGGDESLDLTRGRTDPRGIGLDLELAPDDLADPRDELPDRDVVIGPQLDRPADGGRRGGRRHEA